jgi:hypothetical protein
MHGYEDGSFAAVKLNHVFSTASEMRRTGTRSIALRHGCLRWSDIVLV